MYLKVYHLLTVTQAMFAGSYMIVARKHTEIGVGSLLVVVVSQALGYGLVFNVAFFFRFYLIQCVLILGI
jgi:ER-derived vesicles protein